MVPLALAMLGEPPSLTACMSSGVNPCCVASLPALGLHGHCCSMAGCSGVQHGLDDGGDTMLIAAAYAGHVSLL